MAIFSTDTGSIVYLQISGSLVVSGSTTFSGTINNTGGGYTGSLFGTSSYVTGSIFDSDNLALSSSYTLTASFALNSPSDFPYTGSAEITGSLLVTGSISSTIGFTGSLSSSNLKGLILNSQLRNNSVTVGSTNITLGSTSTTLSGLTQISSTGITASILSNNGVISGSSQVQLSSITGNTFSSSIFTFPQDLIIRGNLTAQQFIVSSSVAYITTSFSSGSTTFGNSLDDVHQFTGSLRVLGSITGSISSSNLQGVIINNQLQNSSITIGNTNINLGETTSTLSGITGISATGITASLLGTASYVTGSIFSDENLALSASFALTASYALNSGEGIGFPFTGSAQITGSLGVTGSITATNGFTGSISASSLQGAILNSQLQNNTTTIGSTAISLGGSSTTITGVSSFNSTNITSSVISASNHISGGQIIAVTGFTGSISASALKGLILNSQIQNTNVTVGTTAISLGGSATTITGLSSLTSTNITASFISASSHISGAQIIAVTGFTGSLSASFLKGVITNTQLQNSNVTIGSTAINLGGTSTTIAGLTSLNSTSITASIISSSAGFTGSISASSLQGAILNSQLQNSSVTVGTTAISLGSSATTLIGIASVSSTNVTASIISSSNHISGGQIIAVTGFTGSISASALKGLILNSQLQNNTTTIGSTAISLGGSSTSISGLVSINSTGITGSLLGTSSWSNNSLLLSGSAVKSFISTASANTTQTISGSLIINQNLTVLGSSSIVYVTSSQLDISTNIITVNTQNPNFRFGGLAVIDSGSSPLQSGSILYDSVQDEWIFVHRGASIAGVTSSHFLVGPETYNNLGGETYISQYQLIRSNGNEHVTGSRISDDGISIYLAGNTQITGALNILNGITGSLFGTSSYVTGSVFSEGNLALSSSFALTASYSLNGGGTPGGNTNELQYNNAGNFGGVSTATFDGSIFKATGSFTGSFTGQLIGTASWATNLVGGAGSTITIGDEGTSQGTATFINFIGNAVNATVSSNTGSITISTGSTVATIAGTANQISVNGGTAASNGVVTISLPTITSLGAGSSFTATSLTGSITASSLQGTITNTQLQNTSVTIGNTAISLGGTQTTISGISSLTTTNFTSSVISASNFISGGQIISVAGFTGSISASFLRGTILNNQLQNSSVTVGSTNISLGGTATTIAGLTSITSTGLTGSLTASSLQGAILNTQLQNSSVTVGSTAISLGTTQTTIAGLSSITSTNITSSILSASNFISGGQIIATTGFTGSISASGLKGTILNSQLQNSSVTIGSTNIGLGGSTTTITGLVSLNSTSVTASFISASGGLTGSLTASTLVGSITNTQLQNSSVTFGTTAINLGSSATSVTGLISINSTNVTASNVLINGTNLNTRVTSSLGATTTTVARISTGSYSGAFWDYVVNNTTNYRAGTVMAVWNKAASVQFTDTSTPDVGDTSQLTFGVIISGEFAELRATATTSGWNIRTFERAI